MFVALAMLLGSLALVVWLKQMEAHRAGEYDIETRVERLRADAQAQEDTE